MKVREILDILTLRGDASIVLWHTDNMTKLGIENSFYSIPEMYKDEDIIRMQMWHDLYVFIEPETIVEYDLSDQRYHKRERFPR